jgi:hypothetical protein
MRVFKGADFSEESVPLVKHKGNEERDITSERCPLCGKNVQMVAGKMAKHKCFEKEK